jgi:hypothetical protein
LYRFLWKFPIQFKYPFLHCDLILRQLSVFSFL